MRKKGTRIRRASTVERAVDAVLAREAVVGEQSLLVHAWRPGTGRSRSKPRAAGQLQAGAPCPCRLPGGLENPCQVRALDLARASCGRARAAPSPPRPPRRSGRGRRRARRSGAARPEQSIRSSSPVGLRAQRFRQRLDLLRRPGAHRLHRPRQQRGVGLGVRDTEDTDRGLAEDVMESEAGPVDGDRTEQGTEGQRRAVALLAAADRARRRSARRPAERASRERAGRRAACRANRLRERARSSRWRAAGLRGAGHRVGIGEHQGGPVETRRPPTRGPPAAGGSR